MPLSLTEFNHFYIINKVCGLEKQRHYLESLGFVPGTQVTILSELHGYYVVMVKGSKIGLDKELAKKIIVYAGFKKQRVTVQYLHSYALRKMLSSK